MSHWAELDKDNKVIRVLVGDNKDPNGDEGYQWLIDNLGGTWIQTYTIQNFVSITLESVTHTIRLTMLSLLRNQHAVTMN